MKNKLNEKLNNEFTLRINKGAK